MIEGLMREGLMRYRLYVLSDMLYSFSFRLWLLDGWSKVEVRLEPSTMLAFTFALILGSMA